MVSLIERILSYTAGLDYDAFIKNSLVVDACAFNFSQLGELSHKLTDEFRQDNPSVPWKAICGMRNKIVPDYDGINLKVVWETITEDLPSLSGQLKSISS